MHNLKSAFKRFAVKSLPRIGAKQKSDSAVPRKIALVNWENMGDFALFTSVIRETKLNFPTAKLIVVALRFDE